MSEAENQAVLVYLDGTSLPQALYETADVATLEDELVAVIEAGGLGAYDGNEFGPTGTTLYMYGPDASALFKGIEGVLRANALCQHARVILRSGGPGAPTSEIRIPVQS
jgi:hypothetical protein